MKRLIVFLLAVLMLLSLCACGKAGEAAAEEKLTVLCVDENNAPVAGAKVQLCTDKNCLMETSDAEGRAVFNMAPGEYDIHAYKAPEGYALPEESEIRSTAADSELVFVFREAADDTTEAVAETVQQYASLEDIDFSDYKLVMVNYWEPWCGWCLMEMPDFQELYEKYRDEGLLIVGMYSWEDGAAETIEELGITYPTIKYDESEYTKDGVPVTIFYDSNGNILPPDYDELVAAAIDEREVEIEMYKSGELEFSTSPEDVAYKAKLDEFIADRSKLEAAAKESADEAIKTNNGSFIGYSTGGLWEARILKRLK